MYYLSKENFYLANFENPDQGYFSDRFSDREAIEVARALHEIYGSLTLVEEDDVYVLSWVFFVAQKTYRRFFRVYGTPLSSHSPNHQYIEWILPTKDRRDRIYLHLEEFAICYYPFEEVQLYVRMNNRKIEASWSGLDNQFIDPILRARMENLATDLWSILDPYRESVSRLNERARSAF